MAIKFGTDGTIYCNTVRYNYKQARNMIADGCYGNISGTQVWANAATFTFPAGYKSQRCFTVDNTNMTTQKLPALYSGHKYYFSCRYKTSANSTISIVLRNNGSDISNSNLFVGASASSFILSSRIISMPINVSKDIGDVCIWNGNTSDSIYVSRFILIDLTDTFGSGNEPSKEWCDNNIREQETLCNFGNVSNNVTYSNIATRYAVSNLGKSDYNYLQLDSNWEPRDYMYYLQGLSNYTEGYLYSDSAFALDNTKTYYAYVDQHTEQVSGVTQSNDFYFPVAEPLMGQIPLVDETTFNGGGGMRDWKRVSAFAKRTSFSNGSYNSRFDFNNMKQTNSQRLTAFNIMKVNSIIASYNNYNGTSITINDVNKEWCDRWIDGRSSPVIHIKDPANTSIKFNTSYDIICNDIEIRPELNKIVFDGVTGTIKCKKLVRVQVY